MNKHKLFAVISIISLLIILISLVSIMVLIPSTKKNNIENTTEIKNTLFSISTEFALKTTSNENLNSDKLRGSFIFIYFGSTHCPHVSLSNLIKMKTVLNLLKKQHDENIIKFIFITADPVNDTKEHLRTYFNKLEPKIIPLTGTKEQIDLVLKNFKAYKILFKDNISDKSEESKPNPTTCIIENSSPFYLIDKSGRLIKTYNAYSASLNIAKDILHYVKIS